jgi:hypothetical protein
MKRLRWVAFGLIAFLVLGSFSISLPRTFELMGPNGAPHTTAYIAYLYEGGRPNPVHPVTYQDKPLALARADSSGRVGIPVAFHAHVPFPIKTHPSFRMDLVYVPSAHNAIGQLNEGSPSRPGVFEIASRQRAVIHDLGDRPELWQGSLMNLASLIHRLTYRRQGERPLRDTDADTAALTRELIAHFRQEYESFVSRYGDVVRPMPALPVADPWTTAEERRRQIDAAELNFAREPTWGLLVARLFRGELKAFDELDLTLRQ